MLFRDANAVGLTIVVTGQRAWDAGTEMNTQNAADLAFLGGTGNPPENPWDAHVRVHSGVLAGIGDSWTLMPNWTPDTELARITVEPMRGA
jgi:hypothetical protein